ncbi:MAG: hypothetical protein QM681_11735 [Novosphingobium sp.]
MPTLTDLFFFLGDFDEITSSGLRTLRNGFDDYGSCIGRFA